MKTKLTLTASALILSLAALEGVAQEKMKYSFSGKPESAKYGQQHTIDVGDVPGHQLRIAELNTKFGSDAPVYAGVKVVEGRSRLVSDYVDNRGRLLAYVVLHMANGDRIYQRSEGLAHTSVAADGSRKTTAR